MPNQDSSRPRRPSQTGAPRPGQGEQRPPTGQRTPGQQPPQPPRRTPPQRRQGRGAARWIQAIIMVLATIGLCVFLAMFLLDAAYDLTGLEQEDITIEVDIPKGAENREIASILENSGVVKYSWVFRIYSDMKTKDKGFQPGNYVLNSNLGYDEIIVKLKSGDYIKKEVRLTFIEGETMMEIARKLEAANVCAAQEFVDYLQTAEYDYEFFNAIEDNPLRFRKLEGYLFPDTYDFFEEEPVRDVAQKFLRNFNNKITDELKERMMEMNLSIDETIILASIIQKEAGLLEDMEQVSSVFHNRLAIAQTYPNLESDVTIFYVNNNIKPYLEQTDQDMYDAYNTYKCVGLPVGAISNPGMDAIMAALYPVQSDYYFFVTDSEETFYFSRTLDEHNRNVALAMESGGEAHGIGTMDEDD